jgi:hypothetical protein
MSSFYAVRRGRTTGIYTDWNVAKHEVLGWPGSEYKKFGTRAGALEFMAQGEHELTEEDKADLSADQVDALAIALDYRVPAMFLTGAAGTGKSCALERIIECLRKQLGRKRVIVTGTTGIAAANIGGVTLHRAMGIGVHRMPASVCATKMAPKTKIAWQHADVLVIDETSMLHAWWLDQCDGTLRIVRREPARPFGGLRLIFVGDFLQLPPVGKDGLVEFAFQSAVWREVKPVRAELTTVHRCTDNRFTRLLAAVRLACLSPEDEAFLRLRVVGHDKCKDIPGATYLYSTNAAVDAHNTRELAKLPGSDMLYEAEDETGEAAVLDTIAVPRVLTLKTGAEVLLLVNLDVRAKQYNGARAKVEQLTSNRVAVRFTETGQVVELQRHRFLVEKGDTVLASRTQFPLRLAYAITSHRAQGLTISGAVVMSIDRSVFECGQAYSMLSRIRHPSQLLLREFHAECIRAHPVAFAFEASPTVATHSLLRK